MPPSLTRGEQLRTIPTNDFKFSIARLSEIINRGHSWIAICKPRVVGVDKQLEDATLAMSLLWPHKDLERPSRPTCIFGGHHRPIRALGIYASAIFLTCSCISREKFAKLKSYDPYRPTLAA
ncbi:hypothetical protein EYR41_011970 [Orbilia oligospora]|uniref:Uncharacterized protein n=1 Tax=Orbilia oligospora TaxID=2813651 RepID=A0A7C8P6K0_ORBOL|nr:hypothetical protein TWF751_002627 [Orbilia oligospora]TGJ62788.1 hypothetical protein EYR41_011970 [Orbilia oligospora]